MSTPSENILVTGGAGYVGSHACKALKQNGYNPITVDNLCNGHRESVLWGPLEQVDILDKEKLLSVFKKYQPNAVLHFAGFAYVGESVQDPYSYYYNNVVGSLALFDVMKEVECKEIIFSSTCAVYGRPDQAPISEEEKPGPINPYGKTKKMVEDILLDFEKAYGFKYVLLRYFNAAGADPDGEIGELHEPETHAIPLCLQTAAGKKSKFSIYGTDYPTPDGTCVRDYVHVSDLAEGHVAALKYLKDKKKSGVFNLGTGVGCSVKELLSACEKITGKKIPHEMVQRRPGDPPVLVANAERALKELDWKPRYTNIESSVEHAWKWHLKNTNAATHHQHLR
jgi:UDP-arabinose 4-epimerase